MNAHAALDRLASCLARLPGVGRRSAERMAQALVRETTGTSSELIAALQEVRQNLRTCSLCGSVTTADVQPCRLCTSPARDERLLCVVEDPADAAQLEQSGGFSGRYHALMGRLAPAKGSGPADLQIRSLVKRVREGSVKEVILALSTDVAGDATASYLGDALKGCDVKITRLAFGLPVGSGIQYADALTLQRALRGRQDA